MPTNFNYSSWQTTVTCSHCQETRTVDGRITSTGADLDTNGNVVTEFIRFLPARGIYHSWCRNCERAARRTAPNRAATRAARTGQRLLTRKFGVELELIFPRGMGRDTITNALRAAGLPVDHGAWAVKSDGSLNGGNGWEVVTPPLSGDAGMEDLRTGMRVLRELGAKPNRSCGTHVHHEIRDLDLDAIKRFVKTWSANQRTVIDGLVSPSRRGAAAPYYCGPLNDHDVRRLTEVSSLDDMRRYCPTQKYRTLNLNPLGRYGTAEIRQHQGTTDFEKVRSWILLGQAIIDTAKAEAAPVPAQTSVMSFLTKVGTMLDETAKTFLLGRAVEFGYATVTGAVA